MNSLQFEARIISGIDQLEEQDPAIPGLATDNPLYSAFSKATAGNRLPAKVEQDAFAADLLGTVEVEDPTTCLTVEKTFAVSAAPVKLPMQKRSLPKPADCIRKTAQGDELFDDRWVGQAYRAVDRAYKSTGDVTAAMQETYDLFSDRCAESEGKLLRGAVAVCDMTSFLRVFSGVLRRESRV